MKLQRFFMMGGTPLLRRRLDFLLLNCRWIHDDSPSLDTTSNEQCTVELDSEASSFCDPGPEYTTKGWKKDNFFFLVWNVFVPFPDGSAPYLHETPSSRQMRTWRLALDRVRLVKTTKEFAFSWISKSSQKLGGSLQRWKFPKANHWIFSRRAWKFQARILTKFRVKMTRGKRTRPKLRTWASPQQWKWYPPRKGDYPIPHPD